MPRHRSVPPHSTMFKCDKCEKHFRAKQDLNNDQKAFGHTAIRSPANFVPAG
ncbi:hypothetical protein M433DRAFT_331396 [Acidomyces richmondensis BFW]|nr:hypothetical protein M433DRAFT_331396 [Acidomyces richmondensis BFW]